MKFSPLFLPFTLSLALSIPAQYLPAPREISERRIDTLEDGRTIEYLDDGRTVVHEVDDTASIANTGPRIPRKKLPHPAAIGLASFALSVPLMMGGLYLGVRHSFSSDPEKYETSSKVGLAMVITGGVSVIVGSVYSFVGSA